jgi:hypothetical protein
MSTTKTERTIEIPAELVPHASNAATYMLGHACNKIHAETERANPNLGPALARFDLMRGLVYEVGPKQSDEPRFVRESYRSALLLALQDHLSFWRNVRDTLVSEGHDVEGHEYTADADNLEALLDKLAVAPA